jgi:hypothetical protein
MLLSTGVLRQCGYIAGIPLYQLFVRHSCSCVQQIPCFTYVVGWACVTLISAAPWFDAFDVASCIASTPYIDVLRFT